MNSNLIIGNTLMSKKALARQAVRALKSAQINLAEARRAGSASLVSKSEEVLKDCQATVAHWKKEGAL